MNGINIDNIYCNKWNNDCTHQRRVTVKDGDHQLSLDKIRIALYIILTKTLLEPTVSLMYRIHDASLVSMVKFGVRPATSRRKERNMDLPFNVRSTSGWNCSPYNLSLSLAMPVIIWLRDCAITLNVSATFSMLSPCVNRTVCNFSRPLKIDFANVNGLTRL